jgi:pimeloyl-ACP methyl ester carboxylesterase
MRQVPFFFERAGKQLFGVYYPPQGSANGQGIVLCSAFGKEHILGLSFLTHFARRLATSGYAAIRFDYHGYGDSAGRFEEATISSMTADVQQACEELQSRADCRKVTLLGARFGGLLALLAAADRPQVERVVLWEPVLDPWAYLYAELRGTVAMQTLLLREVRVTRDEIVANVLAGRPSVRDGYDFNCIDEGLPLGAALVREAQQLSPRDVVAPAQAPTRVFHVTKNAAERDFPPDYTRWAAAMAKKGRDCRLARVAEDQCFWKQEPLYATESPRLFSATLAALGGAP